MGLTVFFVVILGCSALHLGEAALCKQSIIDAIKKLWGTNVPTGLIQAGKDFSQEVVVASTAGYYSEDTTCVYSFFYKDKIGEKVAITNAHTTGPATTGVIMITEADGVLIEPDTRILRYHVIQKESGVTAFYKCQEAGAEGEPEGIIKVRGIDFDQAAVNNLKDVMKSVGIDMVKEYPPQCS